ncbi:MAG TPA: hypothetical protein VKQ52_18815 [Puia sp.]|nr:hypothetical protein [Puia sp.]
MNWIEIKALHDLYIYGEVRLNETLSKSGELGFLADSYKVLHYSSKTIQRLEGFTELYVKRYANNYAQYLAFLQERGFLKPQIRWEERDIQVLMKIKAGLDSGELTGLRDQIIAYEESQRGVSLMFFKNEKYLDTRPSLVEALKRLLKVSQFSNEKDQQYIYRLECLQPRAIVLCENLDFLTKPTKPRAAGIELWYAGGKNVDKLSYADTRGLPVYYSCDWDYDGLFIIYPLVKIKIPSIHLLNPDGPPRSIEKTEHNSRWNAARREDATFDHLFSTEQLDLIGQLVEANEWIIEESNDLLRMLAGTI